MALKSRPQKEPTLSRSLSVFATVVPIGPDAMLARNRYSSTNDLLSLELVSDSSRFRSSWVLRENFHADTGAQPLISDDGKVILAVNGEIYNHIALRASVGPDVKFKTHSDCEVIIPLVCLTCSITYQFRVANCNVSVQKIR